MVYIMLHACAKHDTVVILFGEISTAMTHSEGHLNKYISRGGHSTECGFETFAEHSLQFRPTNQWAERRTLFGIVHRLDNGPISIDHMDFMQMIANDI